jgi:putative ABC transport system permease protein
MVAEIRAIARQASPAAWRPRLRNGAPALAWHNLVDNPARLVRSITGIAFAVLLMLVELGFQHAFLESTLQLIRGFDADIVLISPTKLFFGHKDPFPRRYLYAAAAVRGVASAAPVYGEWIASLWQNPQTHKPYPVQVLAFDPDKPVFSFDQITAKLDELKMPDTVLVDERGRQFLGMSREGTDTELARRTVHVVGTFSLGPNFIEDGTVITSDRTFFMLFSTHVMSPDEMPDVEFGIIKVRPGVDVGDVQAGMERALGRSVAVLTKQQMIDRETLFQETESPIGPVFALGTAIGFAVGLLISYQILFNDLSEQLPQYATLKAMGYTYAFLVRSVLTQSALYAIVGYAPAWLIGVGLFRLLAELSLLPMVITPTITVLSALLALGMCLFAGWLAVRRVLVTDPADVF